jgi:hypothetical protein
VCLEEVSAQPVVIDAGAVRDTGIKVRHTPLSRYQDVTYPLLARTELKRVNRELKQLRTQVTALENRRAPPAFKDPGRPRRASWRSGGFGGDLTVAVQRRRVGGGPAGIPAF